MSSSMAVLVDPAAADLEALANPAPLAAPFPAVANPVLSAPPAPPACVASGSGACDGDRNSQNEVF